MKKFSYLKSISLSLTITSLLLVSNTVTSGEIEDSIKLSAEKYKSGDLYATVSQLKSALHLVQTEKSEIIVNALPEALVGWETDGENVALNDLFMDGIKVEKDYYNDDYDIEISVIGGSSIISESFSMITDKAFVSASGGKSIDIKGYTSVLSKDDDEIEIRIIVNDTTLVILSGNLEDETVLLNYANKIDLDAIK
nr:hypothetical protein BCU55_02545 [Shewanella sp. 10N.286.48.A6]